MSVGRLFHVIHLTADLDATESWYRATFAPHTFLERHYLPAEKRNAVLLAFADVVAEPLAPAFDVDGWQSTPIGRYYERTGPHWHSLAWYADDPAALATRCRDRGVRIVEAGSTVFTHPRDTGTQLQFTRLAGSRYERLDPRLAPAWDAAWWRDHHPLGLRGLGQVTIGVADVEAVAGTWVDALGAERVAASGVRLGDVRVEFVPTGDGLRLVTLRVADLERAERHLRGCGVGVVDRDATTMRTDSATTGGVPFAWTTASTPTESA